ncbi:DNA-binding transcriptional regulator, XRE-family HTH domain [Salinibacillus kushneri]|uniref:DNA-binding transcriptional regulator, XRE-family HTH domain n=1 Tax=Salinibacillus kushneri TaxID=237682 RepID=A0A1I0ACN4_9BACI|nr:helix-turn-helix transcriptional regulator [Salinibacillus kushneri]SES91953.1 DNA-binding transcriptional regulator, XRE-family HTH domain [Salinibacillus kushneri]
MKREWLIQFRKSNKMTQEQVASFAFIDRGYYSQIENGKRDPGITVAINISKALGFDPFMFFQEQLCDHPIKETSSNVISEFFRKEDSGQVLYLFNSFENYIQQAVTFLLAGLEKECYSIIIDEDKNINLIRKSLETIFSKHDLFNHIYLIEKSYLANQEPEDVKQYLYSLLENTPSAGIWLHDEQNSSINWFHNAEKDWKIIKERIDCNHILFVRSYNATVTSAGDYIKMMRIYPYLMTDQEIVESPLYQIGLPSSDSSAYPSLFLQKKQQE